MLKLHNNLTYEDEFQIIIKYAEKIGAKGIFYIPTLDTYCATILLANKHDKIVETGALSYLVGEVIKEYTNEICGEYYPFKINGEHDHCHYFEGVMKNVATDYLGFEIEDGSKYYSENQINIIKKMVTQKKIVEFYYPYRIGDVDYRCNTTEDLYKAAVAHPNGFELNNPQYYYSNSLKRTLKYLMDYQQSAIEGRSL